NGEGLAVPSFKLVIPKVVRTDPGVHGAPLRAQEGYVYHPTMDSSDEKVQIKKQNAERARKYRVRKKLEKEQQQAVAVSGETSVPAAPLQQKQKQDNLIRKELDEYLINTTFASTITEQEKIDAFYNTKLAEKRRKTKERVKRKLNKKFEMATKRANGAAEFEQAIAAMSLKRVKIEEIAADAEFTKQFYGNEFKRAIAYGSKEMLRLAGG
ncbi:hypothetical protein L0F63_001465, partial [Massospora cicadina]